MNLFKAALSTMSTAAQNYVSSASKDEKLRSQLYHCTYSDDAKFVIQKSVKQVLQVYPHFETQILQFTQNGQQKRYIEIKGIMEVDIRGKVCKVDYNLMIPSKFPKKAPYVRIINRNTDYIVDPFYKRLQSPTDPKSYILNEKLAEVNTWNQTKSIVNIIIESHELMRKNFPFLKPGSKSSQINTYNNAWQSPQNLWQNQNYQQPTGFQGGFTQQGPNNDINKMNKNGYTKPQPPIPFNTNSVQETIGNGQKFTGDCKKIMEKLKSQHIKAVERIQLMEAMKFSMESQQKYLRQENFKMIQFLRHSDTSRIKDLGSLIKPQDQRSAQILDLTSSLKAKEECISLLQSKFTEGEIQFEEFIKHVRKMEEQKFQNKALLAKCLDIAMN